MLLSILSQDEDRRGIAKDSPYLMYDSGSRGLVISCARVSRLWNTHVNGPKVCQIDRFA